MGRALHAYHHGYIGDQACYNSTYFTISYTTQFSDVMLLLIVRWTDKQIEGQNHGTVHLLSI